MAPQVTTPVHTSTSTTHSTSRAHSHSHSLSTLAHTQARGRSKGRRRRGGFEATPAAKHHGLIKRSSTTRGGERRGRSPLFLTTLELGGEEQARRSPSHQEQDPVFPSYRGAQHHSFATLGKLKLELNAHVHTTHDHEPINLHQWPRTCLHTIM